MKGLGLSVRTGKGWDHVRFEGTVEWPGWPLPSARVAAFNAALRQAVGSPQMSMAGLVGG